MNRARAQTVSETPPSDDDLTLLQRWRDGDKAVGEVLVRRHYRALRDYRVLVP